MTWDNLEKTYKDQGIVLVLGAGVSLSSGLPSWDELLRNLGPLCLGRDGRALVKAMQDDGMSPQAIASVLEANRPEQFAELVRKALYARFPPYQRRDTHGKVDLEALVQGVQRSNRTLRALAAMCVRWDTARSEFCRNPHVHAIATLNIDRVLRAYVSARYGWALVRSVERPSKDRDPEKVTLYYMHGLLRFDSKAGQDDKEARDRLVLTEQQYFDFFNNPNSIFNYTFLYLLREYTCVFIGLSMQDENLRRLLHYSRKERVQAYREEGKSPEYAAAKSLRHYVLTGRRSSPALDRLVAQSLDYLGVQVCWYDSPEAIPDLLRQLYTAAGEDWDAVYGAAHRAGSRRRPLLLSRSSAPTPS